MTDVWCSLELYTDEAMNFCGVLLLFNPRTLPWAIGLQGFTFPLCAGDF